MLASGRVDRMMKEVKRMYLWVMMELLKAKTIHQDENSYHIDKFYDVYQTYVETMKKAKL